MAHTATAVLQAMGTSPWEHLHLHKTKALVPVPLSAVIQACHKTIHELLKPATKQGAQASMLQPCVPGVCTCRAQQVTGPAPACTSGSWDSLTQKVLALHWWHCGCDSYFLVFQVALETSDFPDSKLNWWNRSLSALTVTDNRAGRDLRKWFRSSCSKARWTHSQHFIFAILTIQRYQHDLSRLSMKYLRLCLWNRDRRRWAGGRLASELSFSPYLFDNRYLIDYLPLYPWCLLLWCFRQNKPNNNEPSSNWQLLPAQLTLAEKEKANDH